MKLADSGQAVVQHGIGDRAEGKREGNQAEGDQNHAVRPRTASRPAQHPDSGQKQRQNPDVSRPFNVIFAARLKSVGDGVTVGPRPTQGDGLACEHVVIIMLGGVAVNVRHQEGQGMARREGIPPYLIEGGPPLPKARIGEF